MVGDLSGIVKANDVRGRVPDELDNETARALGAAFALALASTGPDGRVGRTPRIVVGHDMRDSSAELVAAFAGGATAQGTDVTVIGLCSTDELYYASGALGLPGAMVTASHNPADYNGFKLCRPFARPMGMDAGLGEVQTLAQGFLDQGVPSAPRPGRIERRDVLADYGRHLRSLVDLRGIRPLKVVVDAGSGMAGLTTPGVLGVAAGLEPLPLVVVPLFFELDGRFPGHPPDPLNPANLVDLQRAVLAEEADLGLAFDGDADRCVVVDDLGRRVDPSVVMALVATREIRRDRAHVHVPTIVRNVNTSFALDELIRAAGGRTVRSKVGHSFMKSAMQESNAVFGGEHSAHYYFRDFWFADTGMLAALHVLAAVGEVAQPLSGIISEFERYVRIPETNVPVRDTQQTLRALREAFSGLSLSVDLLDGMTLQSMGDGDRFQWRVNVRPSNTEPLLRLNVEAVDRTTLAEISSVALRVLRASADLPVSR